MRKKILFILFFIIMGIIFFQNQSYAAVSSAMGDASLDYSMYRGLNASTLEIEQVNNKLNASAYVVDDQLQVEIRYDVNDTSIRALTNGDYIEFSLKVTGGWSNEYGEFNFTPPFGTTPNLAENFEQIDATFEPLRETGFDRQMMLLTFKGRIKNRPLHTTSLTGGPYLIYDNIIDGAGFNKIFIAFTTASYDPIETALRERESDGVLGKIEELKNTLRSTGNNLYEANVFASRTYNISNAQGLLSQTETLELIQMILLHVYPLLENDSATTYHLLIQEVNDNSQGMLDGDLPRYTRVYWQRYEDTESEIQTLTGARIVRRMGKCKCNRTRWSNFRSRKAVCFSI